MKPTFRAWLKHLAFLLLTFITTTIAGTLYPFGRIPWPEVPLPVAEDAPWWEIIQHLPAWYYAILKWTFTLLLTDRQILTEGLSFSVSILIILIAHEAGHYIACRLYKIDATLPYFIPSLPMIGPAGTFGAFIRILSPIYSRRGLFDIGVAGPLAGFAALLPIAVYAIYSLKQLTPAEVAGNVSELTFADPLLLKIIAFFLGKDLSLSVINPVYAAVWLGLLVTSLNLIPSGQLDGGHAVFAVFGEKAHRWSGRISFVAMALVSLGGFYFYNSPSGLLITILMGIMMLIKHPQPYDQTPLDLKRKIIAFITLIVFLLSFVPFPIQITL